MIYIDLYVFWAARLIFCVFGLVFGCVDLYFGCLDLYFGCLVLYFGACADGRTDGRADGRTDGDPYGDLSIGLTLYSPCPTAVRKSAGLHSSRPAAGGPASGAEKAPKHKVFDWCLGFLRAIFGQPSAALGVETHAKMIF